MSRKSLKILIVFIAVFILLEISVAQPAYTGMGIAPSKIELTLDPGASQTVEVNVVNNAVRPLKVALSKWDFARDEKGIAYPISPKDVKTFRGCASWVTFASKTIIATAGRVNKATFTVKVPEDAELGTHYTYLRFFGKPISPKKGKVAINYRLDALLLVIVGKKTDIPVLKRSARVKSLLVKRVNFGNPVFVISRLENKSNIHLNLKGKVEIRKGKKVLDTIPIKEYTLLPMGTFPITRAWDDPPLYGKFTAKFIGDVGLEQPLTAEKSFWVVSWKLIALVLAVVAVLVVLAVVFRKKFRLVRR